MSGSVDAWSALEARQAVSSKNRVLRPCMALAFEVSQLGVGTETIFPARGNYKLRLGKGPEANNDLGVCSA